VLGELAGDVGNLIGDAFDGLRGGRGRGYVVENGEEVDIPVVDATPDETVEA
jgi:hypothetical protein